MNEQEFEGLAAKILAQVAEAIEEAGGDTELSGGVLTVLSADDRTFLLNKHAPLRQLWYSSPISGAHHYESRGGQWVSTRDGTALRMMLAKELRAAGIPVDVPAI